MSDIETQRTYIRELASQVAEIAASQEDALIQCRWRDVNALRRPDRAPVWCRPVGAWGELLPEESLRCTDLWLRSIEGDLRRTLIKHEIGDDSPVEPYFPVPAILDCDPPNIWGLEIKHHQPDDPQGAWAFDPPLKTPADYDRLRLPRFTYNVPKTQEALSRAHDLLGDILPVRRVCGAPLDAILGTAAAELRGLSQMMMDVVDQQALMH